MVLYCKLLNRICDGCSHCREQLANEYKTVRAKIVLDVECEFCNDGQYNEEALLLLVEDDLRNTCWDYVIHSARIIEVVTNG